MEFKLKAQHIFLASSELYEVQSSGTPITPQLHPATAY